MSTTAVLAATLVEPGRYELREYPLPEPEPGCLLVRMQVSGICGTDKHTYQGYTTQYAGSGQVEAAHETIHSQGFHESGDRSLAQLIRYTRLHEPE